MEFSDRPHYLLFSESSETKEPGRWRFVLRAAEGSERIVADDIDPEAQGDRLELLTVVRGLEALEQPSRVTVWTSSTYVREGIRYGLREWRENDWCWEYFGQMVPVKNGDLWKRLDRAMQYHRVDCRTLRIDPAHEPAAPERAGAETPAGTNPAGRESGRPACAGALLASASDVFRSIRRLFPRGTRRMAERLPIG